MPIYIKQIGAVGMDQIDLYVTPRPPVRQIIGGFPACGIRTVAEEKVAARLLHNPCDQESSGGSPPVSCIYVGTVAVFDLPFVPDGGPPNTPGLIP